MISKEDIIESAAISMIQFTDEEIEKVQQDLDSILLSLEDLVGLDLEGVEPLDHVQARKQLLREDDVVEELMLTRDEVLQNTENKKYGFFTVMNIMD